MKVSDKSRKVMRLNDVKLSTKNGIFWFIVDLWQVGALTSCLNISE